MEWVTTMSWSELWGHSTLYMPYMLFWDRVTKRILTKGMKGVHIQLETSNSMFSSVAGRLHKYHDIPVFLVWSADSPALCELEPTVDEYETYLKLENEKLRTDMAYSRFLTAVGGLLIETSLPFVPKEKLGDVAIQVLWSTPRYEASEETLRGSLRMFGIPEEKVLTIKQQGTKTEYRLARTEEEEIELKNQVKTLEEMNKARSMIQELLRKVVSKGEATKVDCWVLDIEKGRVAVHIMKPANLDQSHFRTVWERRGFKVEDAWGRVYGSKEVLLPISAGRQQVAEEIAKILGGQ
jgi:regulator of replication initiation timing